MDRDTDHHVRPRPHEKTRQHGHRRKARHVEAPPPVVDVVREGPDPDEAHAVELLGPPQAPAELDHGREAVVVEVGGEDGRLVAALDEAAGEVDAARRHPVRRVRVVIHDPDPRRLTSDRRRRRRQRHRLVVGLGDIHRPAYQVDEDGAQRAERLKVRVPMLHRHHHGIERRRRKLPHKSQPLRQVARLDKRVEHDDVVV